MLDAVAFGGVEAIVFAGGDPTLRSDLTELIEHAKALGLLVELQTNAHHVRLSTKATILGPLTDLIGLSLDAGTAGAHDDFRSTRGNFDRVMDLLKACENAGKPVIVRTVVTRLNIAELAKLARVLSAYRCVVRWSLVAFTPIGDGYRNASHYLLADQAYAEAVESARQNYHGAARIDSYIGTAKMGTYALITPSGGLYGTSHSEAGEYPIVGNILTSHLSELAHALPFDEHHHQARYGHALAPELEHRDDGTGR